MLYGADPEVFVEVNGSIIPCVQRMPGTKDNPFEVPKSKYGLKVQEDGVTLEFNLAPASSSLDFTRAVGGAVGELQKYLRTMIPNATIVAKPSHTFKAADLMSEQAMTLGCDPDNVAWNRGAPRMPPPIKALANDRFAGGHLHFGYDKDSCPVPPWAIIQFIEVMGYGPKISEDQQGRRREFYGVAGLYREKEYGVEYRTPSNFWLNNRDLVNDMLWAADVVVRYPETARQLFPRIELASKDIQAAIACGEWTDNLYNLSHYLIDEFAKVAEQE